MTSNIAMQNAATDNLGVPREFNIPNLQLQPMKPLDMPSCEPEVQIKMGESAAKCPPASDHGKIAESGQATDTKSAVKEVASENGAKIADVVKLNSVGQVSLRVQLKWENVTVVPKDELDKNEESCCKPAKYEIDHKGAAKGPKRILDNVCGTVRPCEFLAIIGASGIFVSVIVRCGQDYLAQLFEQ